MEHKLSVVSNITLVSKDVKTMTDINQESIHTKNEVIIGVNCAKGTRVFKAINTFRAVSVARYGTGIIIGPRLN